MLLCNNAAKRNDKITGCFFSTMETISYQKKCKERY